MRCDYLIGMGPWDARSLFLTLLVSWLLLAGLLFPAQVLALDCGDDGQRACCLGEADFGACRPGNVEIPQANSGLCGGFNPFGIQSSGMCVAVTPCGGEGQRACCLGEADFGACQAGLNEVPQANSGQCSNWLPGIQSNGVCVAQTPCGGEGQRACCVGEAGFGACQAGLNQVPQPNSGQCSNWLPGIQSSGVCVAQTPCGGEGQRACCLGEAGFGACQGGLNQVPQANSGQCSNWLPGIQSSGVCVAQTPCGGAGQRACCLGEAGFGACQAGLNQVPQPNSGQCSNSLPGIQSSGVCVAQTPCGGEGQRACCIGEAAFGACQAGLNQVPQPNSGQCSNSLPGIQSSGVCVAQTPCGGEGQRACCLGEAGFGACQAGLAQVPQANSGQCSNSLPGIQSSGVCLAVCGGEGQRPCTLLERVPSCDAELVEQPLGVSCVHPNCGREGERACTVVERIPSCDGDLVESGGKCLTALPCRLPAAKVVASPPSEPPRPGTRTGPFNLVVLGDSVSWGQGLRARFKYSGRVSTAIANALGVPVRVVIAAHSGAEISARLPVYATNELQLITPEEIPNTFPTVLRQVDMAAARFRFRGPVDLVLVGGCINDVGVTKILNPVVSAEQILNETRAACNTKVARLLWKVGETFPDARIVLTSYYPIVSNSSNLPEVGALLGTAGVVAGTGTLALGIPVVNPVTGALAGLGITEVTRRLVAMNAHGFHVSATRNLAAAARSINKKINGRISFACPPFAPDNAYGAPRSWLWPIPAGGATNDQVTEARAELCSHDELLNTAGATALSLPLERLKCKAASMGHPNLPGSRAYANAILRAIDDYIPYWKTQFSAATMAPAAPAR